MTRLRVTCTLPFARTFDVPVGALIEYAGMSKWLYHSPTTGRATVYFDSQPNSYARDTGGMKGTLWTVVAVVNGMTNEYQVTLCPARAGED
jgi:hypothetical protein